MHMLWAEAMPKDVQAQRNKSRLHVFSTTTSHKHQEFVPNSTTNSSSTSACSTCEQQQHEPRKQRTTPPLSSQAVDVQLSPPRRQLPAIWGGVSEHQGGTARVLAGVVGHLLDGGVTQVGVAGGARVPGGVCNDGVQRRPEAQVDAQLGGVWAWWWVGGGGGQGRQRVCG